MWKRRIHSVHINNHHLWQMPIAQSSSMALKKLLRPRDVLCDLVPGMVEKEVFDMKSAHYHYIENFDPVYSKKLV